MKLWIHNESYLRLIISIEGKGVWPEYVGLSGIRARRGGIVRLDLELDLRRTTIQYKRVPWTPTANPLPIASNG